MGESEAERAEHIRTFYAAILKSIHAAEDHIGVARGAIADLPNASSFVFMIGVYGVIEPILNDLLSAQILTIRTKHKSFDEAQSGAKRFVQKQSFTTKAGLLQDIGLIEKSERRFLDAVAQVRNRYGHNVSNLSKSVVDLIRAEGQQSNSLYESFSGFPASTPGFEALDSEPLLRLIIFLQLSRFISSALHTLQPPPPPSNVGGLFGLGGVGGISSTLNGPNHSKGVLGDILGQRLSPSPD